MRQHLPHRGQQPRDLQRAFTSFYSHFDRVGLKPNTLETEVVVFYPSRIHTRLTADDYEALMGNIYCKERHGRTVRCLECGHQMAVWSLWSHLETQHDVYTSCALPLDATPSVALWRLMATRGDLRR